MRTAKLNIAFFLIATLFVNISVTISQNVGINTTTPRKTLEVAGDMVISSTIDIGVYNQLEDGDTSTFLVQRSTDRLAALNVSKPTGIALAYIQEYFIENPNLDWIKNFETGVDATDYVMIVTSASFDQELDLSNNGNGPENNASLPYATTFVENGTWHIKADYPQAANVDETAIGTWTITTLIFSGDMSKQFGSISIPMSNTSSGSALTPIID